MRSDAKIYIAGHRGMVGSAIHRCLIGKGYSNFILKTHKDLDLTSQADVTSFFETEKPEFVFLAAAKVGGILANNIYRADFLLENLQIQNNVISNSYRFGVKKLLFLGSSCIYPREAPQPMTEDSLLTSQLEYTNEPYAIAKIAGLKLCESYALQYGANFISVMPTNLYGEGDNFDLKKSHVLPALIRKMHLAKLLMQNDMYAIQADLGLEAEEGLESKLNELGITKDAVAVWGSGKPMREFLHADDLAEACVHVMNNIDFGMLRGESPSVRNTHINIGSGSDISIADLANLVKNVVGYAGKLVFDSSKPDGTMKKLLDIRKIQEMGWQPKITLADGIGRVYKTYTSEMHKRRKS